MDLSVYFSGNVDTLHFGEETALEYTITVPYQSWQQNLTLSSFYINQKVNLYLQYTKGQSMEKKTWIT